jgi:hypothetical protein
LKGHKALEKLVKAAKIHKDLVKTEKWSVNELSICELGLFGGVVLYSSTGRKSPKWKNKEGLGRSSAT